MNRWIATCVVGALTSTTAWSQQTGNPAGMAPDTPGARTATAPMDHPNAQDQLFLRQAALGGNAEVELAKLANSRAKNPDVKAFADRMIDEHTQANQKLMKLAKADRVPLPEEPLNEEQKKKRTKLSKLEGAEFDRAYLQEQVADHQRMAHLLEWQITSGQDAQIKAFSKETLPKVLQHLEHARQLMAQLSDAPYEPRQATAED